MSFNARAHHLALRSTCNACDHTVLPHQVVRALLSNADSTTLRTFTRSFPFPPPGIQPPTNGYMLCRKPGCSVCARSPEAFIVHSDCLQLFYKRSKALSHLWTSAAWRVTWRRAPSIGVCATQSPINLEIFSKAVVGLKMPWIGKLPLEILLMIRTLSSDALLWRYLAVLDLIDHMSTIRLDDIKDEPVNQIYRWERGLKYSKIRHGTKLPIFRLSIDSRGIKMLERFASHEHLNSITAGCTAFIIEERDNLRDVMANFNDSLLRLVLPDGHHGFQVWDTPYPPPFELCKFYPIRPTASLRLRTIKLVEVTGLTFFCARGRIFGVHGHTPTRPSALFEYHKLPERLRKLVVWAYLPLPGQETIEGIGIARSFDLVMRTSSNRVYRIGQWTHDMREDVVISYGQPTILLYDDPDTTKAISTIGIGSDKAKGSWFTDDILGLTPQSCPFREDGIYFSSASLDRVRNVRVFNNPDASSCKGILFTYHDGSQQAIGQCGIGAFPEVIIEAPTILYHRALSISDSRLIVNFATKFTEVSMCAGWLSDEMAGTITAWYNYESIILLEQEMV